MKLNKKALGAAIVEGSNMAGERLVTQIVTAYLEALGAAPAAMPSEDEIADLIEEHIPTFYGHREAARAVLALFAPILAEKEREIERLKLDRDAAQLNEAEAIDLMNEYKALLEAAEAAAIRVQGE